MMVAGGGREATDARMAAETASHAYHLTSGRHAMLKGLKGHGVIQLKGISRHGSPATGVDERPGTRREGRGGSGALSCTVSRSENTSASIDHPV